MTPWTCNSCATENHATARFCSQCGQRKSAPDLSQSGEPTTVDSAPPEPKASSTDRSTDRSMSGERTTVPEKHLRTSSPDPPPTAGTRVGRDARYELIGKLGEGGMGSVWRATDLQLGREVAIKRILGTGSPMLRERFQRETKAAAGLRHPNIVTVFDAGEDAAGLYLVMELVPGHTLAAELARGALAPEKAVEVMVGLCRGAAHAHKKGVVHRDIKPGNVMIDDEGVPKLLDFGLVRMDGTSELSMTGVGMGTMDYAAPEQKRDASKADARSDVYALGLVFYEMLTGLRPPVTSKRVPEAWRSLVEKATDTVPSGRHADAEKLLADVESVQADTSSEELATRMLGGEDDLRCPSCKLLNALEAKFCRACRTSLRGECLACGESIRIGLKHCDQCSADMPALMALQEMLAEAGLLLKAAEFETAFDKVDQVVLSLVAAKVPKEASLFQSAQELRELCAQKNEEKKALDGLASQLLNIIGCVVRGDLSLALAPSARVIDALQGESYSTVARATRDRWIWVLGRIRDQYKEWGQIPPQYRNRLQALSETHPAISLFDEGGFAALSSALDESCQVIEKTKSDWIDGASRYLPPRIADRDAAAIREWNTLCSFLGADSRLAAVRSAVHDLVSKRMRTSGLRPASDGTLDEVSGMPCRVVHVSTGAELLLVPSGEFLMGSPDTEEGRNQDESQHWQVIRKPFYLGATQVTQKQWQHVMARNPSAFNGDDLPVTNVSWNSCQEFLKKAGGGLRLPSEAEWEYACRAGTATPFSFGATIKSDEANYNGMYPYGDGSKGLYRARPVPVGSLPANRWGLYEMHGNVWEWCEDCYRPLACEGAEYPVRVEPFMGWVIRGILRFVRRIMKGPPCRVLRGGSWFFKAHGCRAAARGNLAPDFRGDIIGFRLARNLPD